MSRIRRHGGLLAGLGLLLLFASARSEAAEPAQAYVAARRLPARTVIAPEDLRLVRLERRLPRMYPELIEKKRLVPIFWWNAPPSEGWLARMEAKMPRNILELPGLKISESQKTAFNTAVNIHCFSFNISINRACSFYNQS